MVFFVLSTSHLSYVSGTAIIKPDVISNLETITFTVKVETCITY